jgi:2-dehydropantoate 2-reductase
MLCDLEAGRRLETEALIGSIIELAQMSGQAVPSIEAVYACLLLLAATRSSKPNELVARGDCG